MMWIDILAIIGGWFIVSVIAGCLWAFIPKHGQRKQEQELNDTAEWERTYQQAKAAGRVGIGPLRR